MHATGLYMLARLKPGEAAKDRPDIFGAYSHMTRESFARDMERRANRSYSLSPWQREQLRGALDAVCNTNVHLYLFFPPEHFAVVDRYMANDAAGLIGFKLAVLAGFLVFGFAVGHGDWGHFSQHAVRTSTSPL